MLWKKTEELQSYGWLPNKDDPQELETILHKKPLLIEYPYLFKTITLASMELGFKNVRDSLLTHPKCPKKYADFSKFAITNNDPNLLKNLIKNDFTINDKKQSAISISIKANSLKCLQLLLEFGFKPNLENHEELIECLLNRNTQSDYLNDTFEKHDEATIGKTILGQYPYKLFMAIKTKRLCPITKRIEWLKNTDPAGATSLMFSHTKGLAELILRLKELVKKTEKKILKLHCQKELGNIPNPDV